jgi:hypothetical protein
MPQTGEPLPYEVCEALWADREQIEELERFMLVLLHYGWQHSYPAPPHEVHMWE